MAHYTGDYGLDRGKFLTIVLVFQSFMHYDDKLVNNGHFFANGGKCRMLKLLACDRLP